MNMRMVYLFLLAWVMINCSDRKSEIEKAMRQYDELTFRMAADSLADTYLPNGELGGKGMKKYTGRDSIRKFLKSFNPSEIHLISNATKPESISFVGDTALVKGSYQQKAKLAQGDTGVYIGTFTAKWMKENNRWLLASMYTVPIKTMATMKSILLRELKTTHNQKEWFVPVNIAVEGLTAKQAMWKDGSGNHSVGQLAFHLAYWNERMLKQFNNEPLEKFDGNNENTFDKFDEKQWNEVVKKLDDVLTNLEKAIINASDEKLNQWQEDLVNISTHNAYHTGQIITIRKLHGCWNPEKGVK